MRTRLAKYWFLIFISLFSLEAIGQQSNLPPAPGNLPGEAQYQEVSIDTLNIHLDIPIVFKAGIGLPFSFGLHYNNNIWSPFNPNLVQWSPSNGWMGGESQVAGQFLTTDSVCGAKGQFPVTIYSGYLDTNGNVHPLNATIGATSGKYGGCTIYSFISITATDASGFTYNLSNSSPSTVVKADGTVLTPFATTGTSTAVDANKNTLSSNYSNPTTTYKDTLGVQEIQANLSLSYGLCAGSASSTFIYPTSTGIATATVTCKAHTLQTNFGCSNAGDYPATPNWYLPDTLTLGDNSLQYSFTYESTPSYPDSVTGRLASVTFPTGGTINYKYTGPNNGINCIDGSSAGLKRITADGTWVFSRNSSTWLSTTVTDPSGNTTVVNFSQQIGPGAMFMTQRTVTQNGSTSPSETQVFCYNTNQSNCATAPAPSYPITQRDTYTTPGGMSKATRTSTQYDAYSNVTSVAVYDFGATTPTTQTFTSYGQAWNGTTCTPYASGTINNTPCYSHTVSAGVDVAKTQIGYSPTGRPTSVSKWVSGSAWLSSSATFNSNGTVNTATDVNGTLSSYTYAGSYSCGGLLPTSVTVMGTGLPSAGLTTSTKWDCNGAAVTQTGDANQPTNYTNYTYNDPLWRPSSVTDSLQNTRNIKYFPTGPIGPYVQSSMSFGSSVDEGWQTVDGQGRPILFQKAQSSSSSTYDTVSTKYSWGATGFTVSKSIPCSEPSATPCTAGFTTSASDALGRPVTVQDGGGGTISYTYKLQDAIQVSGPTQNFTKQLEYDGLGRLISVCEVTGASGSGSCGQANSATGFLTTYAYSYNSAGNAVFTATQNTQPGAIGGTQTRTYVYDGRGRLITESNPESGTKNYYYDSDSTMCGSGAYTSNGDLVKTTDAAGNCVMYYSDALHRVTDVGNNNQSVSHCKRFRYDNSAGYPGSTKPTGITNTLGRLMEAATDHCDGTGDAIITDEWFSYDADGRLTDVYESTPNSGGYYHTTASYFANGALNVLSGVPKYSAWTFGADGEGRPNSAVEGTTTLVSATGTSYNAASQPTSVSLGSGDSDTYTYNQSTGRMKTYSFNIGGTPKYVTGTLGWNQNGSLGSLVIADAFDTLDKQNCGYSYDDLARLRSVSCGPTNPDGTTWGQMFSYDAFGNVSKSVPTGETGTSWLPNYSNPSNNQYQAGWSGVSYDGNGNLTNDTFDTYTWNAYGKVASINGIALTYDALGRMVEENNAGTYKQILYSPIGKLATMSKQIATNVFLPLPGGEQATYTGTTIRFRHYDWQGSARFESNMSEQEYGDTAYSPFGETYSLNKTPYLSFTGQNQDTVAGTYDFLNREYNPAQGRWISPDPAGLGAVNLTSPQTWNRYAYVGNSPLTNVDPLGLAGACAPGKGGDYDCHPTSGADPVDILNAYYSFGTGTNAGFNNNMMALAERIHENCVAFDYQCDANGNPSGGSGITIWIYCGGSLGDVSCQPPPQAVPGSSAFAINLLYPGLRPGDVPAGSMANGVIQGNAATWRNASGTADRLLIATPFVPLIPLLVEGGFATGDALFNASAWAYSGLDGVVPLTNWLSSAAMRMGVPGLLGVSLRFGGYLYKCEQNAGPC